MKNDKKTIIISEIQYWKNNKLLPATYCDFLLALYTEGNQVFEENTDQTKHKKNVRTGFKSFLYVLLLLMFSLTLLVIYFTELSYVLQITMVAFFLVISFVVTAYFIRKRIFFQVPLSLTYVQLLIGSIFLVEYLTKGDRLWMGGTIIINCLLWIITGSQFRVKYLMISGCMGLVIFIMTIML